MATIPDLPIVANDRAAALLAAAERAVEAEGLPSMAVVVQRHGETLLDAVVGAPLDASYLLWSVSKGLTSSLVCHLVSEGLIDPSQPVRQLLPWFVGGGKDDVLVDHLLLHTAGLAGAPMRVPEGADPARRRQRMAKWETRTAPGGTYAYHHTAAHWALGSIVEAVTGQTFATAFHERIAAPLGMRSTTFAPDPTDARIQRLSAAGDPTPPAVVEQLASNGIDLTSLIGEAGTDALLRHNEPDHLAGGSPGAGAVSQVRDIATHHSALLTGATPWDPQVLADFTAVVRCTLPERDMGMRAHRARGHVIAGNDGFAALRQLPDSLGPRVFGDNGIGGQIAWADPDSGLVFACATNGLQRDPITWWARISELHRHAAAMAE